MVRIYLVALLAAATIAAPKPEKDDHFISISKTKQGSGKRISFPRRDEYEPLDEEETPYESQPEPYPEEEIRYLPPRKEPPLRRIKSGRRIVYVVPPDRYERPEWKPKPRPEPIPLPEFLADFTTDQHQHKEPPTRPDQEPEFLGDIIYDPPGEREPAPPKKIYKSGKPTYKKVVIEKVPTFRHQESYHDEEKSHESEPCRPLPKRPITPPATSCPEEDTEYAECDCS